MAKAKTEKKEKEVKVRIKGMKQGDGMHYACSGLHLAEEHRQFLPREFKEDSLGRDREQVKRKIVPGKVYSLPKSVADFYLDACPDFLETVKG